MYNSYKYFNAGLKLHIYVHYNYISIKDKTFKFLFQICDYYFPYKYCLLKLFTFFNLFYENVRVVKFGR